MTFELKLDNPRGLGFLLGGLPIMLLTMVGCSPAGSDNHANSSAVASSATTSPAPAPAIPATGWKRFFSHAWGFRIDYPKTWTASPAFNNGYFGGGTWKAYATADSSGTAILALTLPGSNTITTAQLRIGASATADAIAQCVALPPTASSKGDQQLLHGVSFLHFRAGDAAMSHFMNVESYRAVHAGRCYAIDLWIAGTRPQVYSPPATPPFTSDQALQRLQSALQTFRFEP